MISANFVSLLFYYYCTYTEHLVFFPLMTDRWMFFLLVCPRKNIFFWKQPCLFVTCRLSCFLRLIYRQSTRIYNIKNVLAKIVHSVQSKVSQPAKISRELQKGHYNIEEAFCQSVFTKGQIISDAIFLVLNSYKKQTKCLQNFALATRTKVLCSFFGRIKTRKKIF